MPYIGPLAILPGDACAASSASECVGIRSDGRVAWRYPVEQSARYPQIALASSADGYLFIVQRTRRLLTTISPGGGLAAETSLNGFAPGSSVTGVAVGERRLYLTTSPLDPILERGSIPGIDRASVMAIELVPEPPER
jgi:hypothetical protein